MINIENLSKSFGSQVVFENATFKINPRERVGLVGRNGSGKTTLFRLIVGEEYPDQGTITIPKHYRIGYVRQHINFTEDTVLKEGMKGLPPLKQGHHWEVEKILAGLGFSQEDMKRHPGEFSGGHQVRLNLAKVLISEPDLLLLDEPTNYLDITSIRWVERFLKSWPHEFILITHDRGLMDQVVTHILGIHRKKIRKLAGNTGKYYAQIAHEEEIYEKNRIRDERRRKEIGRFISCFRAKARLTNLVQSRIKTLAKMEKKEKLVKLKTLDFSFRSKPFYGKYMLRVQDVSFSYTPEKPLIANLSITIGPRDRVFVIGKNGRGKTTLLKLFAGALRPQHGTITYSPHTAMGYFEQTNVHTLTDTNTVEKEIISSYSDISRERARTLCGIMLFEGDDALKRVGILSGGEKCRVMLAKLLVTPLNLLLLDELTNHLDMESCDALLSAIDSFEGAVVMVTHNELFLHALAERLIVFQEKGISIFEGRYQHFLEKGGWGDEDLTGVPRQKEHDEHKLYARLPKKEMRRKRSAIITERSRILKPLEQQIALLEKEIESLERKLAQSHQELEQATRASDGNRIVELSQSIHHFQLTLDKLFEELEALTIRYEEQKSLYERKLEEVSPWEDGVQ